MKKAAFFDIDGTILDHKNNIPQSTIDGIHKLQKNGNYAFLCTGRTRAYVRNPALLADAGQWWNCRAKRYFTKSWSMVW